jgi:cell division protein FtsL
VYGLQAVYGGVQEKNTELDSELKKLRKENKGLEKKLTNYVNLDKEMAKARQKGTWLEKKKVKLAEKV